MPSNISLSLSLSLSLQIAECEEELERLLAVQAEREQLDPEEYSLLLEQAGFSTHEVPLSPLSLSLLPLFPLLTSSISMCVYAGTAGSHTGRADRFGD